eukprot:2208951-Alexandrium_andersonii.AAC.1
MSASLVGSEMCIRDSLLRQPREVVRNFDEELLRLLAFTREEEAIVEVARLLIAQVSASPCLAELLHA